jgi:hypothetical protein
VSLFETAEYTSPAAQLLDERLSAGRRRTLRNQVRIANGFHPVTKLPLVGTGTCGECRLCIGRALGKTYFKCGLDGDRYITCGPATDIRLKWPACTGFEPR